MSQNNEEIIDGTAKKLRNLKPFKSGKDWNGNALGRPKNSISIVETIRHIFESDPNRFQIFIDRYLADPKNRQHIVDKIDGEPEGSGTNVNLALQINQTPLTDEDRAEYSYKVLARVHKKNVEEIKGRLE